MKKSILILFGNILLLIAFISISSCRSGNNYTVQASAKIITEKEIQVADEVIPVEGGQVSIDQPNSPLDGLIIDIPANAYEDDRNFQITYSPITSYNCGPLIHPLTPLINISNGGEYASDVMSVTIPVQVPAGQFAMAFLYNDKTGRLEGLPLAESEADHVTVMTRNFSNTTIERSNPLGAGVKAGKDVKLSQILVSAVDEKELMKDHITPFKPAEDNWQFENHGSYIAPGGHCSGQSMGMLWYYSEKRVNGSPPLYQRFDNDDNEPKTPHFWRDDVMAYKFCSLLQSDWSFSEENSEIFNWQKMDDARIMKAFSYALRVTNEPQFVYIATADNSVAHAIVVYGIQHGDLLVSDPNFPWRKDSKIPYDQYNGSYGDYSSARIASGKSIPFKKFYYLAKTAMVSWENAEQYWKAIADKTIGKGKFPEYSIYALNEQDEFVPLDNNFTVPLGGRLTLSIRCADAETDFKIFGSGGYEIPHQGSSAILQEADLQAVGICVVSAGAKSWMGFKWYTLKMAGTLPPEQIEQPAKGKITLDLYIDGEKKQIDTAGFSVEYDAFSIQGWGPRLDEGAYAWPHYVKIHARNWKGIGHYELDDGGEGTYLWQYHPYPADKKQPGYLNIMQWRYGALEGYFQFEAVDQQGVRKKIDGTFHR